MVGEPSKDVNSVAGSRLRRTGSVSSGWGCRQRGRARRRSGADCPRAVTAAAADGRQQLGHQRAQAGVHRRDDHLCDLQRVHDGLHDHKIRQISEPLSSKRVKNAVQKSIIGLRVVTMFWQCRAMHEARYQHLLRLSATQWMMRGQQEVEATDPHTGVPNLVFEAGPHYSTAERTMRRKTADNQQEMLSLCEGHECKQMGPPAGHRWAAVQPKCWHCRSQPAATAPRGAATGSAQRPTTAGPAGELWR